MTTELTLLAWTLVLALAQVLLSAPMRVREAGLRWAVGARDAQPAAPGTLTGRVQRAQANLYETLPLFAAAVLIAHVAGRNGVLTEVGAHLFFWGRLAFLALYVFGVPWARSAAWAVALTGLILILIAVLRPG